MGRPSIFPLLVGVVPAVAGSAADGSPPPSYPNVTLSSSVLSARVFLPTLAGDDRRRDARGRYYVGSRFEHGSMIGDVLYGADRRREVYGRGMWKTPHDPAWPESGVGLASEFGCGDDGETCAGKGRITNGVLGYDEAGPGEPFLKIGVGALVKGACPACVGDEKFIYRFNSPYQFHRQPEWSILPSPTNNEITFVHQETVGDHGYRIQKTVRVDDNIMTVRTILTNLGKKRFTTPWYSHHFFTGGDDPVGPGYRLDLGLSEYALKTSTPRFRQPGLGTWSADLNDYANVTMADDKSISIAMTTVLAEGVRLKAEFLDESLVTLTDGSFTLRSPNGLSVNEKIPEIQTQSRNPFIYAYNVYVEKGTLSPEPMLLLYLESGETTTWTQRLEFSSEVEEEEYEASEYGCSLYGWLECILGTKGKALQVPFRGSSGLASFVFAACLGMVVIASFARFGVGARRRVEYASIPDHPPRKEGGNQMTVV